jgi:hypothetical protein
VARLFFAKLMKESDLSDVVSLIFEEQRVCANVSTRDYSDRTSASSLVPPRWSLPPFALGG